MKKAFRSENFLFRPTGMSAAFAKIGIGQPQLVREEKVSALLRSNKDKNGVLPSIPAHLTPFVEREKKEAA
jgi:putative aminopeptidase FrvX